MNTGIVEDALALCLIIYNSTPPGDKWAVVNIARSSLATFTYQYNNEIPTSFGYSYDNTPKLLVNEGVIEASTPKRWFTGVGKGSPTKDDGITNIAREKGYIGKDESCYYYWKYLSSGINRGPQPAGHFSVLINMDALVKFYGKYNTTVKEEPSGQQTEKSQISQKKMLDQALVELIKDKKLKRICAEINSTPEQNVISLSQSIGEALKWTVWSRAKERGTKLKVSTGLEPLLAEAIESSYFESNASVRFLKDFKNNLMKTQYDMVRHDEKYVPDITVLNPQIDALEYLLEELYSLSSKD